MAAGRARLERLAIFAGKEDGFRIKLAQESYGKILQTSVSFVVEYE